MPVSNRIVNSGRGFRQIAPVETTVRLLHPVTLADVSLVDEHLIYLFPANCLLMRDRIRLTLPAWGTGLIFSLGVGDADGVIDDALIAASTVGAAGGIDEIDAVGQPLDVSSRFLILDITTAATAAELAGNMLALFNILIASEQLAATGS